MVSDLGNKSISQYFVVADNELRYGDVVSVLFGHDVNYGKIILTHCWYEQVEA